MHGVNILVIQTKRFQKYVKLVMFTIHTFRQMPQLIALSTHRTMCGIKLASENLNVTISLV